MRNRFLTKHGNPWVFQRRLPKALDPRFRFAAIRIRLGEVPLKEARRLAVLLGAARSQIIALKEKATGFKGEAVENRPSIRGWSKSRRNRKTRFC